MERRAEGRISRTKKRLDLAGVSSFPTSHHYTSCFVHTKPLFLGLFGEDSRFLKKVGKGAYGPAFPLVGLALV